MDKPLVTFALTSYNQERYVGEAVRAALAQTYSPLQVVVSDDCSQDGTFEAAREAAAGYGGPHEVVLNRNERNLGIGGNIDRVMELAEGDLIVNADGDDVSLPTRTEELVRAWSAGGVSCVYSDLTVIDEDGRATEKIRATPVRSWMETVQREIPGFGGVGSASAAYDRAVFETFGPLPDGAIHEDYVLELRSALLGKLVPVHEYLVNYRRHGGNISGNNNLDLGFPRLMERHSAESRAYCAEYEDWLRSLQLFLSDHPEMEAQVSRATKIIASRIEFYEFKQAAFEGDGLGKQLRNCLPLIRNTSKLGARNVAKACLLGMSPAIYYWTQQWWYKKLVLRGGH